MLYAAYSPNFTKFTHAFLSSAVNRQTDKQRLKYYPSSQPVVEVANTVNSYDEIT